MSGWLLGLLACTAGSPPAAERDAPEPPATVEAPSAGASAEVAAVEAPLAAAPAVEAPAVEAPAVEAPEIAPAPAASAPAAVAPAPRAPATPPPPAPVAPSAPAAPAVVEAPPAAPVAPADEPPPPALAADYELVPAKNALYVVVTYERGTLGAGMAHDHVVVATRYSGRVHWDLADPGACRVEVDVPVSGLRVDPPGARERASLEGEARVEDHPKIEENFRSRRQLDADAFPVLGFRSSACAARSDGRIDVTGSLTVHGVARPTTVAMTIEADGERFRAKGRLVASHADFGMAPFSAAMGAVRNAEPLTFSIDLSGRAAR